MLFSTQRFQRAVHFLAQLVAAFGKAMPSFALPATLPFELTVAGRFDEVQDVWRVMQNGIGAAGTQLHIGVIDIRVELTVFGFDIGFQCSQRSRYRLSRPQLYRSGSFTSLMSLLLAFTITSRPLL